MKKQLTLFPESVMTQCEALSLTREYLTDYFNRYKAVAIAYSGGKDSTATVTCVLHLIETEQIPRPESLTVVYADTRLELPPLQIAAKQLLAKVRELGYQTKIACAELDNRFLVYLLGRGVPPPNNSTMRWCTPRIKVQPMMNALADIRESMPQDDRLLMLTGVRIGESAVRDRRIVMSCSKNGAECGQGWFQHSTYDRTDTLAPLIHWRLCHVWDWLIEGELLHGLPTALVAQAYGGDEATELNARTGCIGCPLATQDTALEWLVKQQKWKYLEPLTRIRNIWIEARKFNNRLQKEGMEILVDGSIGKNPNRKGPLTLEARERFLSQILAIQDEVNSEAMRLHRPTIDLLNDEELNRIKELIANKTFPNKWNGGEPTGDKLIPQYYPDGSHQPLLFNLMGTNQ